MSVDVSVFSTPAFLGIGNTQQNLPRVTRHHLTQRHQQPAMESRSSHSTHNDFFFDDDASLMIGHHIKDSSSDQMMGGANVVPASAGETSPKRGGQGNGRSNAGRPHVRRGKWLPEEQVYAEQIIHDFEAGLLPLRNGATLRAYLSGKLQCDPMRISKKFAGASSLGKQVFHKSARLSPGLGSQPTPEKEVEARLHFLEKAFWRSVENRKSVRPRNRGPAAAAAPASGGPWPGQGIKSRGTARAQARSVSGTSSSGGASSGDETHLAGQQQQQQQQGNSFSSDSSGFHSAWTTCDGGSEDDEEGSLDEMAVGGFGHDDNFGSSLATPTAAAKPPVTIVWKAKYGNDSGSITHTGKRKAFTSSASAEEEQKDGGSRGDSGHFDADVEDATSEEVREEEEDNMWLDEAADLAGVLLSGDNDQDDEDGDLWGNHGTSGPAIIPSQRRHHHQQQHQQSFSLLEPRMKAARSRAESFGEIIDIDTSMEGAGAAFDAWPLKSTAELREGTSLMSSHFPPPPKFTGATNTAAPSASVASALATAPSAVKIPAEEAPATATTEDNHELGSFFISGMHSTDLGEFLPDECASEC